MMLKIYGLHTPMFIKVVLAAEELGLQYEVIPVDMLKGETRKPEHLARNPFGKVPVIEHNGGYLFESGAILRYCGALAQSPMYPKDLYQRGLVDQWLDYFSKQAGLWCTNIWYQKCIGPKYFNQPTDAAYVKRSTEQLLQDMPVVDRELAKRRYLCGETYTLADLNAFVLLRGWRAAELSLGEFPHFLRWFSEIEARPAVRDVYAKWG